MKRIILALLIVFLGQNAIAQESRDNPVRDPSAGVPPKKPYKKNNRKSCSVFYLNASTGINNNVGLLGISFDRVVAKNITIDAGLGISSWGYKFYLGGTYYLKPCHRGWAFGTGLTYNTGIRNYQQSDVETIYGTHETVQIELHPQANAMLATYHYWTLGKRSNRIFVELGWSQRFTTGILFTQTYGTQMSNHAAEGFRLLSPGGLIIAGGISFGKN